MALLKKHIAFSFEPASGVDYRMLADAGKMERIYFNLLSNAVKYTQENGKIVVRLEAEDNHFRLSVFNSGSYISTTDVEAIFERFYQVDGHQAGTGIGLALVRAFVEMHGGNIMAHSNEKGTTFTVTLPKRIYRSIILPYRHWLPMRKRFRLRWWMRKSRQGMRLWKKIARLCLSLMIMPIFAIM